MNLDRDAPSLSSLLRACSGVYEDISLTSIVVEVVELAYGKHHSSTCAKFDPSVHIVSSLMETLVV